MLNAPHAECAPCARIQRGCGRPVRRAARRTRRTRREVLTMSFNFHVGTPVNWLREARGFSLDCTVRIVLLTAVGEFPAGYVGRLARAGLEDEDSSPARVTLIMYQCSLMDESYVQIVMDQHEPTRTVTVEVTDAWPLFNVANEDLIPRTPTIARLDDAALTLASMLIDETEYRAMRASIIANQ
eukprot:SAG22_NODE_598_length_8708_cov_2.090487_7_plen_184_part_00